MSSVTWGIPVGMDLLLAWDLGIGFRQSDLGSPPMQGAAKLEWSYAKPALTVNRVPAILPEKPLRTPQNTN